MQVPCCFLQHKEPLICSTIILRNFMMRWKPAIPTPLTGNHLNDHSIRFISAESSNKDLVQFRASLYTVTSCTATFRRPCGNNKCHPRQTLDKWEKWWRWPPGIFSLRQVWGDVTENITRRWFDISRRKERFVEIVGDIPRGRFSSNYRLVHDKW